MEDEISLELGDLSRSVYFSRGERLEKSWGWRHQAHGIRKHEVLAVCPLGKKLKEQDWRGGQEKSQSVHPVYTISVHAGVSIYA